MHTFRKIYLFNIQVIIIFFIFFISFYLFFVNTPVKALQENTFYVGGSGDGNFSTIQDAINISNDNDTIYIYEGKYYENLIINKSINLIGFDKNNVIINGSYLLYVILIKASWINISGFTIQNGDVGVFVLGSEYSNNNFSNNFFIENLEGIRLVNSSNNTIYNDIIRPVITPENRFGIVLYESSFNKISNNTITDSEMGIYINRWSGNNMIIDNNLTNNNEGIYLEYSFNNFILRNLLADNEYGVYLVNSDKNNITYNSIENNKLCGIFETDSENNIILPNNFFKNNKDTSRSSNPPKIKAPGFEIIIFILAISLLLIFRKKICCH